MRLLVACLLVSVLGLATGCDSSTDYSANPPETIGGDRPATVRRPLDYDPSRAYPLVVVLHGYSASGLTQDLYLGTSSLVDQEQYVLLIPDGLVDSHGQHYWNATDACCDFDHAGNDDVGYLRALLAEAKREYHIDASRVYLYGHSNGAFMAYRMACEASEEITAIAALAGATWLDASKCEPETRPVSVLHLHGTEDDDILYAGDSTSAGPYPGAEESVRRFAAAAGCDVASPTAGAPVDFETSIAGAETTVTKYESGCARGISSELWTIQGGPHLPMIDLNSTTSVLRWLFAHHR